jgi:hypothetical protein
VAAGELATQQALAKLKHPVADLRRRPSVAEQALDVPISASPG